MIHWKRTFAKADDEATTFVVKGSPDVIISSCNCCKSRPVVFDCNLGRLVAKEGSKLEDCISRDEGSRGCPESLERLVWNSQPGDIVLEVEQASASLIMNNSLVVRQLVDSLTNFEKDNAKGFMYGPARNEGQQDGFLAVNQYGIRSSLLDIPWSRAHFYQVKAQGKTLVILETLYRFEEYKTQKEEDNTEFVYEQRIVFDRKEYNFCCGGETIATSIQKLFEKKTPTTAPHPNKFFSTIKKEERWELLLQSEATRQSILDFVQFYTVLNNRKKTTGTSATMTVLKKECERVKTFWQEWFGLPDPIKHLAGF